MENVVKDEAVKDKNVNCFCCKCSGVCVIHRSFDGKTSLFNSKNITEIWELIASKCSNFIA